MWASEALLPSSDSSGKVLELEITGLGFRVNPFHSLNFGTRSILI